MSRALEMEGANGEKEKTVVERCEDNSWDEWTIINDERDKLSTPANGHPENNAVEDQTETAIIEQAREVIEEIDPATLDNSGISPMHEEESDGISVISESDKGDADVSGALAKFVEPVEKFIPRTGAYTEFVAVCCLAVAIAFGIGWLVGTGCAIGNVKTSFSTSDAEVAAVKSSNLKDEFIADIFDDEAVTIESSVSASTSHSTIKIIPQDSEEFEVTSKSSKQALKEPNLLMKNLNIPNFEKKISTIKDSFEKVQLSLKTLCSLIEDNEKFRDKNNICKKSLAITDVIELKETVELMVSELGYREEASSKKLIQNVESKLKNFSQSFLEELTRIVENFVMKIDQKLSKIGGKLHQRICIIRNTYANNAMIQDILEKRRISLKSCDTKKNGNSDDYNGEERRVNSDRENYSFVADELIADLDSKEKNHQKPESHKNKRKNEKSQEFRGKRTSKPFQEESDENYEVKAHDKNNFKTKKSYKSSKKPNEEDSEENIDFNSSGEREKRDSKQKRKYEYLRAALMENYVEQKRENHPKDFHDDNKENENVCYSKKCVKPHNKEEKHKENGKNGDWQFERAQGRNRYRSDEEGVYGVWYDNRAKARERARLHY